MKPDGVNMETTETNEAAPEAEPTVPQDSVAEQVSVQPQVSANGTTAEAAPQVNGKPVAGEPKVKPKAIGAKMQPTAKSTASSVSSPRAGTVSQRTTNEAKTHKNTSSAVGKKTTTSKPSTAGAVPKRPAASAAFKSQPRVPDKSSAATSGSTLTSNTKPTVNGPINKRPPNEMANGAKLKTAPASRAVASGVHKLTASTTTKPAGAAAASKTSRPATSASAPRPASTMSRPTTASSRPTTASSRPTTASSRPNTGTAKPVAFATKLSIIPAKSASSKVAAAPSNARMLAGQPQKPAAKTAAKKDVCRPTSSAVPKKPTTALASAANRKPEPSKAMATVKLCPASKLSATKAADPKVSQPKAPHPAKVVPTKKPVADARFPTNNKPPLSRSQPSSPANRPAKNMANKKIGIKPIQTVPPFSATKVSNAAVLTQRGTGAAVIMSDAQATETLVQDLTLVTPASEEASPVIVQEPTPERPSQNVTENSAAPSPPEDLISVALLETNPVREQFESPQLLAQDHIPSTSLSSPADPLTDQTPSTSATLQAATNSALQTVLPSNLNDEEDEEEREGSQLVSVSEMSGTTQLTEESRPESGGPIGGSAWKVGGALLSELDSEEVSGSHQGASELSAPGVLEGTESMDDLGEGSLKGAIDMEGASAGSPDFEKVPDIPVNDYEEEEEEDDSDRVCDMDVGSERADEPQRPRHDNDMDEDEDDDVEMASEGVTESGLESYGNADEDDFAEDERMDNLNRVAEQPPPPPLLPSAPAAQWDQPNPFTDPWAEPLEPEQAQDSPAASILGDPWQADSTTPTQAPAEAWLELSSASLVPGNQELPTLGAVKSDLQEVDIQMYMDHFSQTPLQIQTVSSNLSSETTTPEESGDPKPLLNTEIKGVKKEAELDAPASNPSSSSVTEDEASDTEGEALLEDPIESATVVNVTFDIQPLHQHCLATVEEGEEVEPEEVAVGGAEGEDITPPSATSMASYGFDTTASTSNAQSTGEGCIKSPGIFSLEELPEEAKEPSLTPQPHTQPCPAEQQYIECGKQEVGSAELVREEALGSGEASSQTLSDSLHLEENVDDIQPPYYSAIGDKTEDSAAGFTALPLPHRRDHAAYPRTYYDIVKPLSTPVTPPKLTCADLPPRSPGQQALSPQLRRLEQHQRQLLELQQRRAQQSRPLEEVELERKRRLEEEQRRKKEEAEEEIKRNKEERLRREEELKQRKELELQLQQQQEEMKQRQQITQWQHELQQSNNSQTIMLSPSSGLCTIYEALENSDEEELENEGEINELKSSKAEKKKPKHISLTEINKHLRETSSVAEHQDSSLPHSPAAFVQSSANPSHEEHVASPCPSESPEPLTPLELDWGQKVDIVQQLISQTLMLNGDNCSSLLLLPGGAGGTLSPLESSLWPSLLPPLTPPSATVTSVSSFSPEATGSSPQGEWTVVELETHH